MIRIAIVEDERDCQLSLAEYLGRFGNENDKKFDIVLFDDGMDITENYESRWDIIFMDIKMKHMDGMTAARKIREYDQAVIIIFITTMAKFAIKGYEVDALDFVLKPLKYPQFVDKMKKALSSLSRISEHKYLLLPIEDRKERVSTEQILFIEVKSHNLYIVTEQGTYTMRYSISKLEKELTGYHFIRCNNSYLINLKNVTGVEKDIVMINENRIPISRTRKKQFLESLSNYLVGGYR